MSEMLAFAEAAYDERRNLLGLAMQSTRVSLSVRCFCDWIFNTTAGGVKGKLIKTHQELSCRPRGLCCSVPTTRRTVAKAEQLGLITITETTYVHDGNRGNGYEINWDGVARILRCRSPVTGEFPPSSSPRKIKLGDQNDQGGDHFDQGGDQNDHHTNKNSSLSSLYPLRGAPREGGEGLFENNSPAAVSTRVEPFADEFRELGIDSPRCVELAIADGASHDEIRRCLQHAMDTTPKPSPGVIYGRIRALGRKPSLVSAPWPAAVQEAQRLRQQDREHERRKLARTVEVRKRGTTDTTSALADVLVAGAESVESELRERFGDAVDRFDRLSSAEQLALASESLTAWELSQWRKGHCLAREIYLPKILERLEIESKI